MVSPAFSATSVKLAMGLAGMGVFACSPGQNEIRNSKTEARINLRARLKAKQHVSFNGMIRFPNVRLVH
jgi:hypothetical protein